MSRLKSLLTTQGVSLPIDAKFFPRLEAAHLWDGTPGRRGMKGGMTRTWTQLQEVDGPIRARRLTRVANVAAATSQAHARGSCRCGLSDRSARRCWRKKSSVGGAFGIGE